MREKLLYGSRVLLCAVGGRNEGVVIPQDGTLLVADMMTLTGTCSVPFSSRLRFFLRDKHRILSAHFFSVFLTFLLLSYENVFEK